MFENSSFMLNSSYRFYNVFLQNSKFLVNRVDNCFCIQKLLEQLHFACWKYFWNINLLQQALDDQCIFLCLHVTGNACVNLMLKKVFSHEENKHWKDIVIVFVLLPNTSRFVLENKTSKSFLIFYLLTNNASQQFNNLA